jgi:hypothetical protein
MRDSMINHVIRFFYLFFITKSILLYFYIILTKLDFFIKYSNNKLLIFKLLINILYNKKILL